MHFKEALDDNYSLDDSLYFAASGGTATLVSLFLSRGANANTIKVLQSSL
jgi:hypothetical protein